ncbi:MAG: hypothetical protein FJ241_06915 [Nitrospira sp.]|nr:hypothetical protein [Nitrospira sp.]
MGLFVRASLFLFTFFRKRPIISLAIIGVLLCFAFIRMYTAEFGTDLISYIPKDAKLTKAYLEALSHAGGERNCYIILEGNVLRGTELIEEITGALQKIPEIDDVQYRVNKDVKDFYLNMVKSRLPLYLDTEGFEAFFKRLTPDGMEEAIKRTQLRLMMPGGGEIGRIDPLGLTDFIRPFPNTEGFVDTTSGYYMLQGGRGLILIATVKGDARDLSFDKKLLDGIDAVMKRHIQKTDNISVTITGSHAITYYEATQMKREMIRNIAMSLILVGAVVIFFFRDIRVMGYAFLPVFISIFISLSLGSLVLGSLTEAAGGFGAMLVGLGVDLPIVLYVRNLFLRNIEISIIETSSGIWAGALTTWATFLPMAISHFKGIQELGILTSTGIVLCAVVLFSIVAGMMRPGKHTVTPLNLAPLSHMLLRSGFKVFIILFLSITVLFSLWTIKDMRFSVDLRELGSEKNPARIALGNIIKEDKRVFLVGDTRNLEDAMRNADTIERQLRTAGIHDITSMNTFVPPLEKQLMILDKLKTIKKDEVVRNFIEIAKKAGFSSSFIHDYAKGLGEMLSIKEPLRYEEIEKIGILKERFLWSNEDNPPSPPFSKGGLGGFSEENGLRFLIVVNNVEAEKIPSMEGITITSRELIKKELTNFLMTDALKITFIGFVLVNLILFIVLRRPADIIFVQLPILIGILCTGALLTLMGRSIHIMSALSGVMLFGMGTDYAIHFVHHIRRGGDLHSVFSQTGSALILCALTTMCGFGTLYFSSYKGLSDMGLAITVGTLLNLIFTFLFVPLFKAVSFSSPTEMEDTTTKAFLK